MVLQRRFCKDLLAVIGIGAHHQELIQKTARREKHHGEMLPYNQRHERGRRREGEKKEEVAAT